MHCFTFNSQSITNFTLNLRCIQTTEAPSYRINMKDTQKIPRNKKRYATKKLILATLCNSFLPLLELLSLLTCIKVVPANYSDKLFFLPLPHFHL